MKVKSVIVAGLLLVSLAIAPGSFAQDGPARFEAVAADMVIARPLWLVATVVGAGLFVVSIPIAATSGSVNKTARTLVVKPARATFTRPLGDFSTVD